MSQALQNRTMALAGVFQAALLVQKLATHGSCDEASLRESLQSILVTDPRHPLDVFADNHLAIRDGYRVLADQLGGKSDKDVDLMRYLVSLLALERDLSKNRGARTMLGNRIAAVSRQLDHFDLLDEPVLANLASIYSDVISPIGPKIQVTGSPLYLQQPLIQHKVRALLLAGLRSAVLWRQLGGRRTQILFSRKKMVEVAKRF